MTTTEGTARAGVSYHSGQGKWMSRIRRGGEYHFLGYFHDYEEAVAAREAAELKFDGKVTARMTRSAFDQIVAEHYPTPGDWAKPATGMLPRLPSVPAPNSSMTVEELFSYAVRKMTIRQSVVFWRDTGEVVRWVMGAEGEQLLRFDAGGERHTVRHANVAWMLTHSRPIPPGHRVKHSNGNVMDRHPHNLWIVAYDGP